MSNPNEAAHAAGIAAKAKRLQDAADQQLLEALVRLGVVEVEEVPADEPPPAPVPPPPAATKKVVKGAARKVKR